MALNDTDSLIARVKLLESLPTGDGAFNDDDIIDFLDQELQSTITPLVLNTREDYLCVTLDYTGDDIGDQGQLTIPSEATGLRLRDVYVIDGNGNFSAINRLEQQSIAAGPYFNSYPYGFSTGYYLQGSVIQFYPHTAVQNTTVRLVFARTPATLCSTSEAGQIINIANEFITVSNAPVEWDTGTLLDFIKNSAPHEFVTDTREAKPFYASAVPLINVPLVDRSGTVLELTEEITDMLSVGDWVTLTTTSPVVQYIPTAGYPLLCQAAAVRCLESLNDREGQQMAIQKYTKMEIDFLSMIQPRVTGQPKRIVNRRKLRNWVRPGYGNTWNN